MSETLDNNFSSDELYVSEKASSFLITTCKWAKFLAVMGFIGAGIIAIVGLFMLLAGNGGEITLAGAVYIIMSIFYIFPSNHLLKFSNEMMYGLNSNKKIDVEEGFENLKSFFKFVGIFTIVIISIYILIFIFAALVSANRF